MSSTVPAPDPPTRWTQPAGSAPTSVPTTVSHYTSALAYERHVAVSAGWVVVSAGWVVVSAGWGVVLAVLVAVSAPQAADTASQAADTASQAADTASQAADTACGQRRRLVPFVGSAVRGSEGQGGVGYRPRSS